MEVVAKVCRMLFWLLYGLAVAIACAGLVAALTGCTAEQVQAPPRPKESASIAAQELMDQRQIVARIRAEIMQGQQQVQEIDEEILSIEHSEQCLVLANCNVEALTGIKRDLLADLTAKQDELTKAVNKMRTLMDAVVAGQ